MITISIILLLNPSHAQNNRSLEVERLRGTVVRQGGNSTAIRVGDRLSNVGEGLLTGSRSNAILAIDSGIGTVNISENTDFQIRNLAITENGGRVTLLNVARGQVRLNVRPFTNPQSRLEIETPSGIAGVRGTEFGIGVSDDGRTSVATVNGAVAVSAQGETVLVEDGYGSIIVPGEAPSEPILFSDELDLNVEPIFRDRDGNINVKGQVNPLNYVWINNQIASSDINGNFELSLNDPYINFIKIKVKSPLGDEIEKSFIVRKGRHKMS